MINRQIKLAQDISNSFLSVLNISTLLDGSIEKIVEELDLLGGILFLRDENTIYAKAIGGGDLATKFIKLMGISLEEMTLSLKHTDNLIVQALNTLETTHSYHLGDFTRGVLSNHQTAAAKFITNTKSAIAMPLIHNQAGIGAMYLSKSKKEDFTAEISILEIISNNLAIAISNASLYQELKQERDKLSLALEEIHELRTNEKERINILIHNIRNPLTGLKGSVDIITSSKSIPEKISHIASTSIDQLISVLDRFYVYLRGEAQEELFISKFDIGMELEQIFKSYQPVIQQKGLRSEWENKLSRPLKFRADKLKFNEIISNLLTNAIKYTNKGKISVQIESINKDVVITIVDTGVGIAAEDIDLVGTKFFRSYRSLALVEGQESHTGSGLGMYIVQKYVELMHGKMNIDSVLGKGTIIKLYLPVNPPGSDSQTPG